jgi:integrase
MQWSLDQALEMKSNNSSYLTKSRHGTWYFQRWIPKNLRRLSTSLRLNFRISLRTKNKQEALKLSRILLVRIDKLADKYFDNPKQFGRAMELLAESIRTEHDSHSFREYEESFLLYLDENEDSLLADARTLNTEISQAVEKLESKLTDDKHSLSKSNIEDMIRGIWLEQQVPDSKNPTLEELFAQWSTVNKDHPSKMNKIAPSIDLFVRYLSHIHENAIRITEIDIDHIHQYQDMYKALPKGTKVSGVSFSKLLRLKGDKKSPKTIKDNFSHVNLFLSWAISRGYPLDQRLLTVMSKGSGVVVDEKSKKRRVPLSDNELNKLFHSKAYTESGKFFTSAMYWAPIISAFTGARQMEILQLESHDIKKIDGIWVFDFDDLNDRSEDELKRLKNVSSRRQVPIHPEILKLGFIEYVDTCSGRLFPDEVRNKHGKFDRFQKRHANYRKKVGVQPDNAMQLKDFHSFRHTVETRLMNIRATGRARDKFDTGIIDGILGHASKAQSIGQRNYNHSQYIEAKNNALSRLKFDSIDFDEIIPWNKCSFSRAPYQKRVAAKLKKSKN